MKTYVPHKPLISIHVPKAGGSSFQKVLSSWFREKLLFHYFDERNNRMPVNHSRVFARKWGLFSQKDYCIHGHYNRKRSFGVLDYYPRMEQCIMILRDPVETAISNYFYLKEKQKNDNSFRDGKVHTLQKKNVNDYLMEAGASSPLFFPIEPTFENYKDQIDEYFVHIGIMEDYQRSIDIIAEKLGKETKVVPHENKSQRTEEPSAHALDSFSERNRLAIEIYNHAVSLNV